jgi:excisionase family DNA binding protein
MKMYSLNAVAEMLGVTYNFVWNKVQQGKIKTVRVGRSLRVTQEELDRISKDGVE